MFHLFSSFYFGAKAYILSLLGITWEEAVTACENTSVVPACHNDARNVTLSGPDADVELVVSRLREEGKTVTVVDSAGTAFHSPMLEKCRKAFEKALKKVREPKPKSINKM